MGHPVRLKLTSNGCDDNKIASILYNKFKKSTADWMIDDIHFLLSEAIEYTNCTYAKK